MNPRADSCSCFGRLIYEVFASPTARSTDDLQCCKRLGTAVQAQGRVENGPIVSTAILYPLHIHAVRCKNTPYHHAETAHFTYE